ncbi:helix-turn-helix domain-containing protein (plasmid) [Polymorphobacter sp. PAMC 29334]|nr:helix-turn-helix domain-containing protein [Polymorphobacter sp. PAMC 29334]
MSSISKGLTREINAMDLFSTNRDHTILLSAAMRAIRSKRRMRASEVARAMALPLRTYERFEAGHGPLTFERIASFAKATNSDPVALIAVLPLGRPEFATWCADNKLMTIMMMVVDELADELGPDIGYLETGALIATFTRATRELVEHFRKRDIFAETWLSQRSERMAGSVPLSALLRRRQAG